MMIRNALLDHLSHNTLNTSAICTPFGLFRRLWHHLAKLFSILLDQACNNGTYLLVADLRGLQVTLKNVQFALLFFGEIVSSTLLIQRNGLVALLGFLLQHAHRIRLGQRLTIFRVLAISTSN